MNHQDDQQQVGDGKANSTDPLTGIGDRAALKDAIRHFLSTESALTVVLLDLDEFRVVNESLGHDFGDQILVAAARRLGAVFADHLFRAGGDEFAVLLPTHNEDQVSELADIVLTKWRTPLIVDNADIYSGISIGSAIRTPEHHDPGDLLRDAEIAMYEAKRLGRNRAVFFRPELKAAADAELETQMLGRRAVVNREFQLFWQPMFDAMTGTITSCEALLRWRPAGGLNTLPAADFIPFLERSGLIIPVGELVIEQAFQQYAQWAGRPDIAGDVPISMNISRRQIESGGVVDSLLSAFDSTGMNPRSLIVEISESVTGSCTKQMRNDLQHLRDVGVRVGVDDFGGGQASLLAMADFPMDIVKLDRTAASRVTDDKDNPLLSAIHDIIKSRDLTSVVTGVETKKQLRWFQRHGWDWVQGYFVGKPADEAEATKLLAARNGARAAAAA